MLIVDDHPLVGAAITATLKESPLIADTFFVSEPKAALAFLRLHRIELLILDIELGNTDGFSLYRRALLNGYNGKVLFLSAKHANHLIRIAAKLGAQGVINKSESLENISLAIELVLRGQVYFPHDGGGYNKKDLDQILTEREFTVMGYLVEGLSNKQIGEKLFISNKTVSTYKTKIFEKLEVDSVISLAKLAEVAAV
ncbi:response regulator transcription factor [Pseudoalteromonas prydzensis]|uniref:response regulator transcription factor n=1 Tax=Pseudoalteromonas prydzensis TaxID=182141 RepID=UPI00142F36E9|nr:response regulator transcription factor [Pseudoalteromonas prydzensis]